MILSFNYTIVDWSSLKYFKAMKFPTTNSVYITIEHNEEDEFSYFDNILLRIKIHPRWDFFWKILLDAPL